jgi:predicted Zn-dependent protease
VRLFRVETGGPRISSHGDELALAMDDMRFSYDKINKKDPWAAEMAVAIARVLRLQHKPKDALELLDKTRKLHPEYPPLYTAYTAILFDEKDYAEAAKILAEGNQATGDKIGEIQYFLGIALFRSGDIEGARRFEAKAREAKYPLHRLTKLLADHDKKHAKKSAK